MGASGARDEVRFAQRKAGKRWWEAGPSARERCGDAGAGKPRSVARGSVAGTVAGGGEQGIDLWGVTGILPPVHSPPSDDRAAPPNRVASHRPPPARPATQPSNTSASNSSPSLANEFEPASTTGPHRLARSRTHPSHGWDRGSNPLGVTRRPGPQSRGGIFHGVSSCGIVAPEPTGRRDPSRRSAFSARRSVRYATRRVLRRGVASHRSPFTRSRPPHPRPSPSRSPTSSRRALPASPRARAA